MSTIGIDIGGTKCTVSRLRGTAEVEEVQQFPTLERDATLQKLEECVRPMIGSEPPLFGISCGGPLDAVRGVILSPPNLPGWEEVEITKFFVSRFGGRAVLMNDANASALAEWQFGAGRGTQHMVFLTFGTGMGGGLILNGRLYEGATGDAGEVGHLRLAPAGPVGFGKFGSFEGFCSGAGLPRLAALMARDAGNEAPEWLNEGQVSAKIIAGAADAGEAFARRVMTESGRRLGEALAILVDVLNPERIVIGGIFPRCERLLRPGMEDTLAREALPHALAACRVVPAQLGEQVGGYAGVAVALHDAANRDDRSLVAMAR